MPRTKKIPAPNKRVESKGWNMKEIALMAIDGHEKMLMASIDKQMEKELIALDNLKLRQKAAYPLFMLNRTIREIVSGELDSTLNSTKASKKYNQTMSKRSASFCCDEGYTTAESSRGTTSGDRTTRQSRSKTKTAPKSVSRSLSRNTAKKTTAIITPANKRPPNSNAGSITPKCKPNTPQIIIRRPKIGEMAWSNQGSPLLTTHTVTAEQVANVNIPLPDGNVVSLLPQRGVRVSQIPSMEDETRKQLKILRDNLIKICGEIGNDN